MVNGDDMINNFSLEGWKLFSDRRNSTNYISEDGKWLLKIFGDSTDLHSIAELEKERQKNLDVATLGINVPKVGEIVHLEDGRYGMTYEYIQGKKSFSRAISEEPENVEKYAAGFAEMALELHSTPCNTELFKPVEYIISETVKSCDWLSPENRAKIARLLDRTEKRTTCLHMDFQPGNFVFAPSGRYYIDLGMMVYGNPLYDLGVFYFMSHYWPEQAIREIFKTDRETLLETWKYFVKHYFNIDVQNQAEFDRINDMIKPYAAPGFLSHGYYLDEAPGAADIILAAIDECMD